MKDIKAEIEELNERVAQLQKMASKSDIQRILDARKEQNTLFSKLVYLMNSEISPLAKSIDDYNGDREVLKLMRDVDRKVRSANDGINDILRIMKKHYENRQDD